MKLNFILILSVFQLTVVFGQSTNKHFSIGLVPSALFDPITTSLGIAAEHSLTDKINIELNYGLDIGYNFLNWDHGNPSKHHEYRLALKYFISNSLQSSKLLYVGLDVFGNHKKLYQKESYYKNTNGEYVVFESAEIIRIVNGFRFMIGRKFSLSDNIWLDFSCSIGPRVVERRYETINPRIENDLIVSPSYFVSNEEGKQLKFSFAYGLKIAYVFYSSKL